MSTAEKLRALAKSPDVRRFVRFLFVGGLNTAFGYGLFALLMYLGVHYSMAGLVTMVIGMIWNFHTVGVIVFDRLAYRRIVRYLGVYVFFYFESLFILQFGEHLGYSPYLVAALMLLPNAWLGYVLNKHIVFAAS